MGQKTPGLTTLFTLMLSPWFWRVRWVLHRNKNPMTPYLTFVSNKVVLKSKEDGALTIPSSNNKKSVSLRSTVPQVNCDTRFDFHYEISERNCHICSPICSFPLSRGCRVNGEYFTVPVPILRRYDWSPNRVRPSRDLFFKDDKIQETLTTPPLHLPDHHLFIS